MPPLPVHPAKFTRVLRAWSAGFLLAAGLLATLWVSLEVKKSLEADAAEHFSLVSDQVAVKVRDRLDAYAPDAVLGQDDNVFSRRLDQLCLPRARLPALSAMAATGPVTRHVIELANASQTVLEVALRESHAPGVTHILYLSDITHETEVDRMKSEFLSTAAHELLDLARIEARRGTDFVFEITPVQALIEKVVREFKLPDGRAPPSLIAAAGHLSMRADPQKVQQAVLNVLSNAYKYSPAGGVVQIELLDSPAHEGTAAQVGIRIAAGWNWTANSALEPRSRCGGPKV